MQTPPKDGPRDARILTAVQNYAPHRPGAAAPLGGHLFCPSPDPGTGTATAEAEEKPPRLVTTGPRGAPTHGTQSYFGIRADDPEVEIHAGSGRGKHTVGHHHPWFIEG